MSNYRIEGTIRKLIIGNQKEGFKYEIGKYMDKAGFTVSEIIFNERHFDLFGEVRYEVYVKREEEVMLWKSFINQPVMLEFLL